MKNFVKKSLRAIACYVADRLGELIWICKFIYCNRRSLWIDYLVIRDELINDYLRFKKADKLIAQLEEAKNAKLT